MYARGQMDDRMDTLQVGSPIIGLVEVANVGTPNSPHIPPRRLQRRDQPLSDKSTGARYKNCPGHRDIQCRRATTATPAPAKANHGALSDQ